jgi:Lantibiotic dehydratase, N terminus
MASGEVGSAVRGWHAGGGFRGFDWLLRAGTGGNDAGWAIETGIFWPVRRRRVVTSLPASAPEVSLAAGASHRVPLEGTTWSVWRDVCLRGAGFPADMVLAVCDEPLARSADLTGRGPGFDVVFADATMRLSRAIAAIHADPVFQEALTWQNPGLAQFLQDHGISQGAARRTKDRERELVIANYLQRYCLKNDMIGFFGPVGWARADPGTAGLVVVPGQQLVARRTTYFEVWAIDKVAAAIAGQGRVQGWLRPRRTRSAFLDGNVLRRPHRKPVTLTDAELRILLACDGSRTISDVLDSAGAPDARALLTRLAELGALRMDLEGPADAWPERLLRQQLELIADPDARAAALEPVDQMIKARDAVAATDGDPKGLQRVLAALAETFEQLTGAASTRRAGKNYAGRTLVYQDAVRDVRVELGEAVTRALAAPLGLVLDSIRWLVNEITDRYREYFAELIDRETARAGRAPVPLSRLLTVASPYLYTHGSRGVGELATASLAELQRRWQEVLGPPSSPSRHQVSANAISARAAECFPGRPVAWSGARQHSPDIMIAAASPGEVERGNFLLVLGEIHLATNTMAGRCFVEQHPDRARLIAAEGADHGPRRIVAIPAKDHPNVTSRTSPPSAVLGPGQLYWSSAIIDSLDPPDSDTVMPGAAMSVIRRGEDLVVQLMPSGTELDFFEVIADEMAGVVSDAFQPVAPAAHRPRITIDRFVLSREQWTFQVADSGWAFAKDEQERYRLARCWRQDHDLPERVFYRVPVELKPTAADFRSIVLVNLFAKHIRQTKAAGHAQYIVTEMLPDLDQLWLADRAGRRYSSELRFVAYDGMTEDHPPPNGRGYGA